VAFQVRGAHPDDLPAVRDIISSAWENPEDEPALWDYIASAHPGFSPDAVRVAVAGGRPVACAVVLPCRFRTTRGLVPGAELTLVACRPEYRRRGYGGAVVRDALEYMAGRGLALAVFRGDPAFYGRFGGVPVLPGYRTTLEVAGLDAGTGPGPRLRLDDQSDGQALRPVDEGDLRAVAALYRWGLSAYMLAASRPAEPWLWRVRNRRLHALLALPDLAGYAFVSEAREAGALIVREAAVAGVPGGGPSPGPAPQSAPGPVAASARRLLRGLIQEAAERGLGRLEIILPPDSLVARLAAAWGAGRICRPPKEGLGVVTLWEALLPQGWQVVRGPGERADAICGLALGGRMALKVGPAVLTQLVTGCLGIDDALLAGQAELLGDQALDDLRAAFPGGYTCYFEAPYFFWL